ncbi:MAG: PDZ domain-containing protein [Clostridia bacterium]|nr:PDZ domain-containing protein [Clostridia bacterium]
MLLRKNILKSLMVFMVLLLCIVSFAPISAAAETQTLYLGGFPAGFTLNTTTVEVIGICEVMTSDGMKSPARESGIRTGDVIDKINGREVNCTKDVNDILADDYKKFEVTVLRGGEILSIDVTPVMDLTTKAKRLGVLVKDSINGIGTVTYIDKTNNKFASLGHPVTDLNGSLIEINGGTVYGCFIYDVKKGVKGTPGELRGAFESSTVLGKATVNCGCGIYGDLSKNYDVSKLVKVEKGSVDSVKMGKACIYSTLEGTEVQKYDISIVKVDKNNKDNRNFVIKIDDDKLINKSGGIVQGMSGSPIVQNGKIIGAVTHVFINDPTRGYGISIDKMLNSY